MLPSLIMKCEAVAGHLAWYSTGRRLWQWSRYIWFLYIPTSTRYFLFVQ